MISRITEDLFGGEMKCRVVSQSSGSTRDEHGFVADGPEVARAAPPHVYSILQNLSIA